MAYTLQPTSFSLLHSLPMLSIHLNLVSKCGTRACSSTLVLCSTQGAPARLHDNGGLKGHADDASANAKSSSKEEEQLRSERGVQFLVGNSFYRKESAVGRDLGVLAAAVLKKEKGQLRVLDALCGSGIRAARYLAQAQADFVWANDACDSLKPLITHNLSLAATAAAAASNSNSQSVVPTSNAKEIESVDFSEGDSSSRKLNVPADVETGNQSWQVTIEDANKVLLDCYMRKNYYDLIDVDSFGSDSVFLGSALSAVSYGGLVYVTSTDGLSAGGHRPYNALASYGAYIKPMSFANELGLRMLIGGVVREAALRNMHVYPVFSHYSCHGPVFRVMLRVLPNKMLQTKHYKFVANCNICGETQVIQWNALGRIMCLCSLPSEVSSSMTVSGPLWTGPLHNVNDLKDMIEMAKCWGWIERDLEPGADYRNMPTVSAEDRKLKELLDIMLEESHPDLQVGYIELDEISKRGKFSTPRRARLITALHEEGFAASRSHIAPTAIKTNCSLSQCVEIARVLTTQSVAA